MVLAGRGSVADGNLLTIATYLHACDALESVEHIVYGLLVAQRDGKLHLAQTLRGDSDVYSVAAGEQLGEVFEANLREFGHALYPRMVVGGIAALGEFTGNHIEAYHIAGLHREAVGAAVYHHLTLQRALKN